MRLSLERLEARENPSPAGPQIDDPLAPPNPNTQPPPPPQLPPSDPSNPPPPIPPVIW
jgi:hypothetical protein